MKKKLMRMPKVVTILVAVLIVAIFLGSMDVAAFYLADYSYALPVIEESHFPEELIVNTSAELLKSCIQYKRNMWKQKKVNC